MTTARIPELGPSTPRRGWRIIRFIGRTVFAGAGWSMAGRTPDLAKGVIIVAPHTSNWDFVIGAAAMMAIDLDARFLGKHTLFRGPLGVFMRWLGGIPVDRSQSGVPVIERAVEAFRSSDSLILALAPEGTRTAVSQWKTGFHRIAVAAGVPIVAVALDWGRRTIRFREPFTPTDDLAADLVELRRFFADARGKRETRAA